MVVRSPFDCSQRFYEAFFVNQALIAKKLVVTHVFMDDTSCTNEFAFPLVSVLCRDDSDTVHCVAWGVIKTERRIRLRGSCRPFPSITDIKTFVLTGITRNRKRSFKCLGYT